MKKIVVVSRCFGWRDEARSQRRFSTIRFLVLVGFHGGTTDTIRDGLHGGGIEQIWVCVSQFTGYVIITKKRMVVGDEGRSGCFGLAVVREGKWVLFLGCVASVWRCSDRHS